MKILVINAGSSSLKYRLFDMSDKSAAAGGVMERIGEDIGIWSCHTSIGGRKDRQVRELKIKTHRQGLHLAIDRLSDPDTGVIDDVSQISAVGHRVVQGGELFNCAVMVDKDVKQAIRDNIALAPLHNPANLTGIETAEALLPGIPNIAVFDTQFHQTMPAKAFLYGLPYEYYTNFKIRRYGFHGISHKYMSQKSAGLMHKKTDEVNLITLHLGNGCSISAIEKGRCIDTSMGLTPLAGVIMGTRTGDMDPAVVGYLMEQTGMGIKDLEQVLNSQSGLKGICGQSDFRDIHKAAQKGDSRAALAMEMFCCQAKKYIGAYAAILGDVDALVFSAGVGENDANVRTKICENLGILGIELDEMKNQETGSRSFYLHTDESRVQIWVVPANEEVQIANEVSDLIKGGSSDFFVNNPGQTTIT